MKKFKNTSGSTGTWVGQEIANGAYYEIQPLELLKWQTDSKVLTDLGSGDGVMNDGTSDITDVATAVAFLRDELVRQVQTRTERSNVSMKLCRHSGTTSSGSLTMEFKVPGTFGESPGRLIAGGFAFFANGVPGDYIEEINVVDKDNEYGLGAGAVLKTWHDAPETSYQTSGIWLHPDINVIQSMGDWGEIPAGLYLQLKIKKKSGESDDTFYATIVWGEAQ